MKRHNYHETTKRIDPDGRIVVRVLLSNASVAAEVYEEDYLAIAANHGRCSWFLNSNGRGKSYVRLKGNNENVVQVSRLILGDRCKGNITYRDGNHLNLRTTNLHVLGGPPKRKPKSKPLGTPLNIPEVTASV